MIITSLLYIISAYEIFHRKPLLSGSEGNLHYYLYLRKEGHKKDLAPCTELQIQKGAKLGVKPEYLILNYMLLIPTVHRRA